MTDSLLQTFTSGPGLQRNVWKVNHPLDGNLVARAKYSGLWMVDCVNLLDDGLKKFPM